MEELLQEFKEAQAKVNEIYQKLLDFKDGYRYLTRRAAYHNFRNEEFYNDFSAGDLVGNYNGDNGVIEVFTTNPNPNHGFARYHQFQIVTDEEYEILLKGQYGDDEIERLKMAP